MTISTSLHTRYVVQKVAYAIICIIFGLWGLYDYVYKIPNQEFAWNRNDVYLLAQKALQVDANKVDANEEIIREANVRVGKEIEELVLDDIRPYEAAEWSPGLILVDRRQWLTELIMYNHPLQHLLQQVSPPLAVTAQEPGLREDEFLRLRSTAFDRIEERITSISSIGIKKPSKFNRMTQWAFIACLPFAPIILLGLFRQARRKYRLDKDGTLTTPKGVFPIDSIEDINMTRWSSSSGNARSTWIAEVTTRDGRTIQLDDLIYKNMHLVIGGIASRMYPDKWTAEAKVVPGETGTDGEHHEGGESEDMASSTTKTTTTTTSESPPPQEEG